MEKRIINAKLDGKKKLHSFLKFKLTLINILMFIFWATCLTVEIIDAMPRFGLEISSELLEVSLIGIIVFIPIVIVAEGIGIYKKWGVSVEVDVVKDSFEGKGK